MKTKVSHLKVKTGRKQQHLSLILGLILPLLSSAAVKQAQPVQQEGQSAANEPVVSSEAKQDDNKSLANEPEPRGKLLYENHCISCHESTVHIREAHKAKAYADIQYWVGRWAEDLDLKWSADEIDAVVQYLNDTFYHYLK